MLCEIWGHLNNLKNVKKTHAEVLLLVKLQLQLSATFSEVAASACNFTKSNASRRAFFHVFQIARMIQNRAKHHK